MTFNTANDFIQPHHLVVMLRESNADIIALVELGGRNAEILRDSLHTEYPHRLLFGKRFDGKGLLSRYPIVEHEIFTLLTPRPYIQARLEVERREITIFVVHAPAPNYRHLEVRRSAFCLPEIKLLLERGRLNEPTLYMGDFNVLDYSSEYRLMIDAGLIDTFRAVGSGSGLTFPTRFQYLPVRLLRMVRIDYIWVTKHFQPISSRVAPGYGSDHLPVISEVILQDF
jgi:endonuclease/exonuclease/phosphatase family metal-dependent hydrolase